MHRGIQRKVIPLWRWLADSYYFISHKNGKTFILEFEGFWTNLRSFDNFELFCQFKQQVKCLLFLYNMECTYIFFLYTQKGDVICWLVICFSLPWITIYRPAWIVQPLNYMWNHITLVMNSYERLFDIFQCWTNFKCSMSPKLWVRDRSFSIYQTSGRFWPRGYRV